MPVVLKNNARTVTRQDLTAVASTIVVADGSVFPTLSTGEYFYLTLIRSDTATEVVKVLAVVDTSLTVTRAQEGTAAREFPAGSFVEARVTAASVLEAASDAVDALTLGDLGITATATELNILDGATLSTAELNILDGVTATTAELNILDGATLSTAELNILDGVTTTAVGINSTVSNATQTRDTVALLLADTTLTYTAGQVGTVTAGSYVRTRAEGFSYRVAASGATDHHVATAGGVKLYVLPGADGFNVLAFGAKGDNATNDTAAIQAAINTAAQLSVYRVIMPAGVYRVTTLYFQYDATNNPNFPAADNRQGRIELFGAGPCPWISLRTDSTNLSGTVIYTTSATGPALQIGDGATGADTARKIRVSSLSVLGVCTNNLIDMNAAPQHTFIDDVTFWNTGTGGNGIRVYGDFYVGKFSNIHGGAQDGVGMLVERAALTIFETVNMVFCGVAGFVFGSDLESDLSQVTLGVGIHITNCQASNCYNGMQLKGGRNVKISNCWFEQNTGEYDLKINNNSQHPIVEHCLFISTNLTDSSVIVGDNTIYSARNRVTQAYFDACAFSFVGPTSSQTGIKKFGTCDYLLMSRCSWKNNGGVAIRIDTTGGVTPTILDFPDFFPAGASTEIGTNFLVRNNVLNVSQPWLVRGLGVLGTITPSAAVNVSNAANNGSGLIRITTSAAHGLTTGQYVAVASVGGTTEANGNWQVTVINSTTIDLDGSAFVNAYTSGGTVQLFALDMRSWTHLPDSVLFSTTSTARIAMPNTTSSGHNGLIFSAQKTLAGNSLITFATNINGTTSVTVTADEATINLRSASGGRYMQV